MYHNARQYSRWDFAVQSGVRHGVIRLPEDGEFDYSDIGHWKSFCKRFNDFGITPVAIEPMPNELHDHIKAGDEKRDESIERVICQGKFTTAQIDRNTWSVEMLDMLLEWINNDPRGEEYRDLDWSREYDLARNGDPNDTQTAL